MAKTRVKIIGGGIGGLTAAYHLSRTPALRARYDVEVLTVGHRVGGKLASGRDVDPPHRSVEHGLHVWFGFYDNAFALLREVWQRWDKPASCPLRTWDACVVPQSFTPIGGITGGKEDFLDVTWPTNPGTPGSGQLRLTPWQSFVELLHAIELGVEALARRVGVDADIPDDWVRRLERAGARLVLVPLRRATSLFTLATATARAVLDDDLEKELLRRTLDTVGAVMTAAHAVLVPLVRPLSKSDVNAHDLLCLIEVGCAFVRGMCNPAYGIFDAPFDLDRIDHLEFRAWLKDNGCDRDVADHWRGIKALYDTCFQYVDGDVAKPSFSAGTAARVVLRIVTQYQGAVLYLFTAGVGEVLIAPLLQVLEAQGVSVRFFQDVRRLELSADRRSVARIHVDEQVRVLAPPYRPLINVGGLVAFPREPLWDQLEDGAALKLGHADFESPWTNAGTKPPPVPRTLEVGTDFDVVVLATALGAAMPVSSDVAMVQELVDHSAAWDQMCKRVGLAPSIGLQLWMNDDLRALGWRKGKPALVGHTAPASVWADMTQVIATESFADADEPGSLHYLCGTLGTDLYRRPRGDASMPHAAEVVASAAVDLQLATSTRALWPNACIPGTDTLDPARVAHRVLRTNVAPTECCETTPPGSARARLCADESGFDNLFLAGAWVRTGIDASCVEAAVMSGMQAARALCGEPVVVVGERYFHTGTAGPRLPRYRSRRKHGEQSIAPPGEVLGASLYVFLVPGARAAMQASVDEFLHGVSDAHRFEVMGDSAVLTFLDGRALTSTAEVIGKIPDREAALWIPLWHRRAGALLPEPMLWMPYVIVDSSIACITGRESWGFLKEVGGVRFPSDPLPPPGGGTVKELHADAMTFLHLASGTQGAMRTLLRVHHPSGRAGQDAAGGFNDLPGLLDELAAHGVDRALAEGLLSLRVPVVNLKQFRDAQAPELACYQALVESSCRLLRVHDGAWLKPGHLLDVLPCDSHHIAADLGLASSSNLVLPFGVRVTMDFAIDNGRELR